MTGLFINNIFFAALEVKSTWCDVIPMCNIDVQMKQITLKFKIVIFNKYTLIFNPWTFSYFVTKTTPDNLSGVLSQWEQNPDGNKQIPAWDTILQEPKDVEFLLNVSITRAPIAHDISTPVSWHRWMHSGRNCTGDSPCECVSDCACLCWCTWRSSTRHRRTCLYVDRLEALPCTCGNGTWAPAGVQMSTGSNADSWLVYCRCCSCIVLEIRYPRAGVDGDKIKILDNVLIVYSCLAL